MDPEDHIAAGQPASRQARDGFAVADDLAALPVTNAEIDVIEAFLMAQFRGLMSGETVANAAVLLANDSEPPQTHGSIARSRSKRGARR